MSKLDRRRFLKCSLCAAGGAMFPQILPGESLLNLSQNASASPTQAGLSHVEAKYYKKLEHKEIECELCPRKCKVGDRERGYCGCRENQNGIYYTLVHSYPCSAHVDPIEKKPLFHFLPGTKAFSIATAGCNINCKFCQNWEISQVRPEQVQAYHLPPEEVASYAQESGSRSIAYTYSEPVVFYEYMLDCAIAGKRRGIKSVVITAGYINHDPWLELIREVDAIKVDFKAFTEEFYQDICSGKLKPVMDALVDLAQSNIWYELVYLVVPTLNDNFDDIRRMCKWMIKELGRDVPLHFTRFHPMYLLKNLPPTPVSTLERAREIALEEGMNFVYVGNVPGHKGEHTYCPDCKQVVIERVGYRITQMNLKNGKCKFCGKAIPGVWS
ncbi:MAG: AmmeMemoRadiSam system radical SAM enzyme [candidate division Zixibacteria bacterium]|nr:AmmeMemoRadiSam system radical SAM enzyme [candidate division Zixibacteria bacterium]